MNRNAWMMRLFAALTVLLLTAGAYGQQTAPGTRQGEQRSRRHSTTDRLFVHEAATGGQMEVQLGKLAQEKATKDEVKQFGQRMVTDHTKVNEQLQALAQQKGFEVPTQLKLEQRNMVRRLTAQSGAAFDRAYMQAMVNDHRKDVAAFERQARRGRDPELKKFASDTVPILREHLQMAQQTLAKLTRTEGGTTGETTGTARTKTR